MGNRLAFAVSRPERYSPRLPSASALRSDFVAAGVVPDVHDGLLRILAMSRRQVLTSSGHPSCSSIWFEAELLPDSVFSSFAWVSVEEFRER